MVSFFFFSADVVVGGQVEDHDFEMMEHVWKRSRRSVVVFPFYYYAAMSR
jgi:hypothetical protein